MGRVLPGWMMYADADRALRQAGPDVLRHGWPLLQRITKRRFQRKPGKRRRRFWYVKQADFEHILTEAKAAHTELVLDKADD